MPAGHAFTFGPYRLEPPLKRLLRDGAPVVISARQFDLLMIFVVHAGEVLSKNHLIEAAWPEVSVTDNSLEQAISELRQIFGAGFIETQRRRGYRFVPTVTKVVSRETDEALEALLAPHRAWIEGRAALETLEREHIRHARDVFERVLREAPGQAPAHVGLANACVMQFEMTRAEAMPDVASLEQAARHAREACGLDPQYGEAWATLGFVLERAGRHDDALAAARRAVTLEPDNWRHRFRLSYCGWGEERLRAAGRTLALVPGFPLAHWLAATVHVARQALPEAERELRAGIATQDDQRGTAHRFSGVALHWLLGLVLLARGEEAEALAQFERELADETSGHLYARECCANACCAIGALHFHAGRDAEARDGFLQAIERVTIHPMARAGLALVHGRTTGQWPAVENPPGEPTPAGVEAVMAQAALLGATGQGSRAAALVDNAVTSAPASNSGWLLPVEPLIRPYANPAPWATVLARIRAKAV